MDTGNLVVVAVTLCGCAVVGWLYHVNNDPEVNARIQAARSAAMTPHVIREADGCKVYAFQAENRWHYFTRCPASTTSTDTAHEVCRQSGKTRTCHTEYETIQ